MFQWRHFFNFEGTFQTLFVDMENEVSFFYYKVHHQEETLKIHGGLKR